MHFHDTFSSRHRAHPSQVDRSSSSGGDTPPGADTPDVQSLLKQLETILQGLEALLGGKGAAASPTQATEFPASSTQASGPAPMPMPTQVPTPALASDATNSASSPDLSTSVADASSEAKPKFLPVIRGDEAQQDALIHDQASFDQAVDRTAQEYGIPPNVFRAEMQVESGAMTGYQQAMKSEGDLDRAGDNNTSIGIGQISRKFLDGRDWSQDGPGNAREGGQVVTTAEYEKSPTVQLRMAASNLAQRVADGGSLESGLAYYVSGNSDPNTVGAKSYIDKIDAAMKDPAVEDAGRI